MLIQKYKIDTYTDVQVLQEQAKKCHESVTAYDHKHSRANAKSILGLMSLSYQEPISVECNLESFFSMLPLEKV